MKKDITGTAVSLKLIFIHYSYSQYIPPLRREFTHKWRLNEWMNEWISGWMAGCEWVTLKALKKANERWRSRESRWNKWNAFSTYAWFSFWYEWMLKWRRKKVNQSWKKTLSHLIYTMFNIFMIITGNNTHSSSRSFTNDVSVWSQEQENEKCKKSEEKRVKEN